MLQYPPVKVVQVRAPQCKLDEEKLYSVVRGPMLTSWTAFQANSISNSSVSITCNPPTRSQLVSRRFLLRMRFTLSFAGTGNPLLQLGTLDGLRAYPLAQVITSQNMDFANAKISSQNLSQFMPHILRYSNDFDSQNRNYSYSPSMFDTYQLYSQFSTLGSAKNPLAFDGENAVQATRGGFPYVSLVNGNGTATVVVEVTEPIWMSPFTFEKHREYGAFTNIENMTYTATFGNLTQMWCHDVSANTLSSFSVAANSAELLVESYAPDPTIPIPRSIVYSFYNPVPYISAQGFTVAPAASALCVSQNIQLSGIPKRLYLFVQEQYGDRTYTDTDTFFRINQVTFLWNTNNYLTSASAQNLYEIAVKNGIGMSWNQWYGMTGGILALNFGDDIGLQPGEAPGSMGKYNLQVTMNVTNIHPSATFTPALYMVAIYEGSMSVIEGTVIINQSALRPEQVLEAKQYPGVSYCSSESVYGGNIFSDIAHGAVKIGKSVISNPITTGLLAGIAGQALGVPAPIAASLAQGALSQASDERRQRAAENLEMKRQSHAERLAEKGYEAALELEALKQAAKKKGGARAGGARAGARSKSKPKRRGAGFGEAAAVVEALAAGAPADPLAKYLATK